MLETLNLVHKYTPYIVPQKITFSMKALLIFLMSAFLGKSSTFIHFLVLF